MTKTDKTLPPLPLRKPTVSAESRLSGCTHRKMTRIFDELGDCICSVCKRHPSLGWLYRCTQDTDGFLPKTDFTERALSIPPDMDPSRLRFLSPSVLKAIGEGQYTHEQIEELIRQKDIVREAITQNDTRPTTAASTTETQDSTTFSAIPESTTFSTTTSASPTLDEELRAAYDWQALRQVWQDESTKSEAPPQKEETDTTHETATSFCNFRICATCRPTYRERAYQSLDDVLKNPVWPPPWEWQNRRVSDVRIVRKLGVPKSSRFYPSDNEQDIQSQHTFDSQHPSLQDEGYLEIKIPVASSKRSSRSSFRETVRNALTRARDRSTHSRKSKKEEDKIKSENESSTDSLTQITRSMIFRRKPRPKLFQTNGNTSTVVGNESLQNSLNLMLAANTPLPTSGTNTPRWAPGHDPHPSKDSKASQGKSIFGHVISQA